MIPNLFNTEEQEARPFTFEPTDRDFSEAVIRKEVYDKNLPRYMSVAKLFGPEEADKLFEANVRKEIKKRLL